MLNRHRCSHGCSPHKHKQGKPCVYSHSLTFSLSSDQAIPKLPFKVSQIPTHSNSIQTLPSSVRRRQSHEPGRGTHLHLFCVISVCLTVCLSAQPTPLSLSLSPSLSHSLSLSLSLSLPLSLSQSTLRPGDIFFTRCSSKGSTSAWVCCHSCNSTHSNIATVLRRLL